MLTIINSDSFYTATLALTPVGSLGTVIHTTPTRLTLINSNTAYTVYILPTAISSLGTIIPEPLSNKATIINSEKVYKVTLDPIKVDKLGAQLSRPTSITTIITSNKTYRTTELPKIVVTSLGRMLINDKYYLYIVNTASTYKVLHTPIGSIMLSSPIPRIASRAMLINSSFYSAEMSAVDVLNLGYIIPPNVHKTIIVNNSFTYYNYELIPQSTIILGQIIIKPASRLIAIQTLTFYTGLLDSVPIDNIGKAIYYFTTFILRLINNTGYYSARVPAISLGYPVPVITGFSIPLTSNNLTTPIDLTYTGQVIEHALSEFHDLADCTWVKGIPTSYTFNEPRQCKYIDKNVYLAIKNNYEGISDIAHVKTQLYLPDTISPTINTFIATIDDSWVVKLTIDITDNIGVTRYCVTEDNVDLLPMDARFKLTKPTTYKFITIGEKTLYLMARDAAGNISKASINLTIPPDTISPIINSFNVIYKLNSLIVDLEIDAFDARGIVGYNLSETLVKNPTWLATKPSIYKYKTSGDKQLYLWVRDEAGNISEYTMDTCSLQSTLTGNEQLNQQLTIEAISLDAIKTYISDPIVGSTSGVVQSESSIIQLVAGENIGGHRVVSQVNGIAYYASNMVLGIIVGISIDAANKDDIVNVQFKDILIEPSWNWNMGLPVFIGVNGLLTQVVPETGYLQVIATPLSSKSLMINIQEPIQL